MLGFGTEKLTFQPRIFLAELFIFLAEFCNLIALFFDDFKQLPNDGKRIIKSFDFRDFHAIKIACFSSKINFDPLFLSIFYSSAAA